MTTLITYIHTWAPKEYETGRQMRQVRRLCHLQLRREKDLVVWDIIGQEGNSYAEQTFGK